MSQHTFYRKYRSNTFDEIVGQTHIVDTLKNAIANDRLTHAYIFSGPRGTGKTSVARILAKSLNCREALGVAPCLTCDICQHITNGTSVDIVEIDAASNTGVDNIRSLNDTVNFSPVECRYKLYIIDEAHMLSTGAFNALLKTLEEPPENTIFILATTEPHKIPITIHSRCQHLHFRNLTIDEITSQLQFVSKSESLTVDDKGLALIAKNAGGCMRDGLSLLNQAYSFKGSSISYDDVLFVLGTTEDGILVQLLDAVFTYDHKTVIETLQKLIQSGANSAQLLTDLIRISTQLVHTALGLTDLVDGTPDYQSQLQSIHKKTTQTVMTQLLAKLADIEGEMRWFSYPSLLLQIRLVEFMTQRQSDSVTSVTSVTPPKQSAKPPEQIKKPAVTKQSIQPPVAEMPTEDAIVATKPAPAVVAKSSPGSSAKSTDQSTDKIWETVLDDIKKQSSALYSLLRESTVARENDTTVYIALKQSFKFFIDKLSESHHQDTINIHLANYFTPPKQFKLYDGTAPSESSTPSDPAETVSSDTKKPSDASDIQRINQVVKLFEGTIV
jgi:DNA polymerase-3 subunit gamma/tau